MFLFKSVPLFTLVGLHDRGYCLHTNLRPGGIPPSTFVRTKHASNSGVDTSTVIQLKKAHTTCDKETGEVEIGWPENGQVYEGLLGKDIFASGATKNVYKVFSCFPNVLL